MQALSPGASHYARILRATAELIIRIIKITPAVRALRLGSARVICLFGIEHTDGLEDAINELTCDVGSVKVKGVAICKLNADLDEVHLSEHLEHLHRYSLCK